MEDVVHDLLVLGRALLLLQLLLRLLVHGLLVVSLTDLMSSLQSDQQTVNRAGPEKRPADSDWSWKSNGSLELDDGRIIEVQIGSLRFKSRDFFTFKSRQFIDLLFLLFS